MLRLPPLPKRKTDMNDTNNTSSALPKSDVAVPSPAPAPVILCVDDEPNILSSLRRLFRTKGYQVRTAEGGAAGLRVLESEAIDVVISDMRMPGMDGAQFLQHVRHQWPETVRLLMTGYADINAVIDAINRGEIYRYITKPWDENDIVLVVRNALEYKQLAQDRKRLEVLTTTQNEALKALNAGLEERVTARTAELGTANGALQQANDKLKGSFVTSIKVFSTLIEMRGSNLAGHSRRVAELARKIALKMGLDSLQVQEVFVAGLLHEIGKLGFTDDLLAMPVAIMQGKHLEKYRQHAVRGEQLLLPLLDLRNAAACIGAQLERFDGHGFPEQLANKSIPIGARILAAASDYDNLQIGVLAQRRLSPDEAKAAISQGSGRRYDPQVVNAFLATLSSIATEELEKIKTGEIALAPKDLVAGMVLSRDLVATNGLLMLSAEHALDERLIQTIVQFEKSGGIRLTAYVWSRTEANAMNDAVKNYDLGSPC